MAVAPAFALQKLTEQMQNSALALNLVHANLGRVLCATGGFNSADQACQAVKEHKDLASNLEDPLQMFETALNDTADDIALRQDVAVVLSKVLWAKD
ncbi:hypothetical protein BC940DRAFT_333533 [Gongronella butleri]|nr:hypothetical protein BC940DRAFT_333533 [Gongronella butleri]